MKASRSAKDGNGEPMGYRAALFPALSEGSREKRAVSILLACMEQVPELAQSLLRGQGAPLGKKSRLQAWTEAGPVGKKGAARPASLARCSKRDEERDEQMDCKQAFGL